MYITALAAFCSAAALTGIMLACAPPAHAYLEVTALQVLPRLDLRATGGDPAAERLRIQQSEISVVSSISDGESEIVSLNLQHNIETPMTGRARDMHFSNLYAVFNLGVAAPRSGWASSSSRSAHCRA